MLEYIQYNSLNLFKGVLYYFQYLKLNPKDVKNVKRAFTAGTESKTIESCKRDKIS